MTEHRSPAEQEWDQIQAERQIADLERRLEAAAGHYELELTRRDGTVLLRHVFPNQGGMMWDDPFAPVKIRVNYVPPDESSYSK